MLDVEKWARLDWWFLEEGAMLLLGLEPFDVYYLILPKPNAKGFDDIYQTASRSAAARTLNASQVRWASPRTLAKHHVPRWQYRWKVSPRDFLAWARKKGYPIPQGLEEAVNRFHPEPKDRPEGGAENSDLTPLKQQNEKPAERAARIAARHEKLKAAGDPHPTKALAAEEGCSESWIRQRIQKARKSR